MGAVYRLEDTVPPNMPFAFNPVLSFSPLSGKSNTPIASSFLLFPVVAAFVGANTGNVDEISELKSSFSSPLAVPLSPISKSRGAGRGLKGMWKFLSTGEREIGINGNGDDDVEGLGLGNSSFAVTNECVVVIPLTGVARIHGDWRPRELVDLGSRSCSLSNIFTLPCLNDCNGRLGAFPTDSKTRDLLVLFLIPPFVFHILTKDLPE